MAKINLQDSENLELITVAEAARMLNLARKTIHNRKGGTGKLKRVYFGTSVRLIRSEVEKLKADAIEKAERVNKMIFG